MNLVNLKTRLIDIQYQFLRDNTTVYSDEQIVNIATSIIAGIVEDLPAGQIIDTDMPTSFMGCTLDWSPGAINDKVAKVIKGTTTIESDLSDAYTPTTHAEQIGTAFALTGAINGDSSSLALEGYTTTNEAQILLDATNMITTING